MMFKIILRKSRRNLRLTTIKAETRAREVFDLLVLALSSVSPRPRVSLELLGESVLDSFEQTPEPEFCICSAIRMPDGEIILGHRHFHCLEVVRARIAASGPDTLERLRLELVRADQGFITSTGRFVDREEAARLQIASGRLPANGRKYGLRLYSEDLY